MVVLTVIGFLAIIAGIIMVIVNAIRKKGTRVCWGIVVVGLLAFIIGLVASPGTSEPISSVPTSTHTPTSGIYSINQDVNVGNTAKWKVLGVRNRGSVLTGVGAFGSYYPSKTTVGKFIEVTLMVENIGNKTETSISAPVLVDSKDREFERINDDYYYVPEQMQFLIPTLQPNIPKQFIVIYEVPQDSTGLKLKVHDFSFFYPKTALIDLGL